jgi:hypothetical protein
LDSRTPTSVSHRRFDLSEVSTVALIPQARRAHTVVISVASQNTTARNNAASQRSSARFIEDDLVDTLA